MLFSVIMQSYLGEYAGTFGRSASDRVAKFHRAVQSVVDQEHQSWELLVVADGCDLTWEDRQSYEPDPRVRFFRIPKQRMWSPVPRNVGIVKAQGQYVIYLDSDDSYAPGYLAAVASELEAAGLPPWAAVDDLVWEASSGTWSRRMVTDLLDRRVAGTSNVVHHPDIAYWPEVAYRFPAFGYAQDDRGFVAELGKVGAPTLLSAAGYRVHHIPRLYDV
jgi:glycosyltransferase involved in cell wall biosynthesis